MKKLNPTIASDQSIKYLIGIDGGGTGTRVLITDKKFNPVASAHGAPSALGQGIEKAWKAIIEAINRAFLYSDIETPMLSECAIGLGLSGANNSLWKNEFFLRNPGFKYLQVDTDGYTTLLGAHYGKPGIIVAVGTGSVGLALYPDQKRIDVSGWGFPSGDEASGAWLGLRAAALTQKTIDKRRTSSSLDQLVLNFCEQEEKDFLHWLGKANQNTFAKLAPLVFQAANENSDNDAQKLLLLAGQEIREMIAAIDQDQTLPLSICGSLGKALIDFLPEEVKKRHIPPMTDSTEGALFLLREGK